MGISINDFFFYYVSLFLLMPYWSVQKMISDTHPIFIPVTFNFIDVVFI